MVKVIFIYTRVAVQKIILGQPLSYTKADTQHSESAFYSVISCFC